MAKIVQLKASLELLGISLPELPLSTLSVDEVSHHPAWEVAASGTQAINFGGVTTASVVVIRGDRALTYTLNSGSDAITVNAEGIVILFNVSVTALSITNSDSSNTLVLDVVIAGT